MPQPFPQWMMGVTDGSEVLELVGASLGARNDVMNVERRVAVSAEEARDGTPPAVAV